MSAVRLVTLLAMLLRINLLYATNYNLPTKIFGSGNTAVCAGDRLTFTCVASSNSTTQERWSGSSWTGSGNQLNHVSISITDPVDSWTLRDGAFNVSIVSLSPFVTQVVVGAATLRINGTTVTCRETRDGANFIDVGTGCVIFAAPPSDPEATPVSCTLDSVTLQWKGSLFDGGSNLTNYTLTTNPATSNCNGSCSLDHFARQYTFSGLQPGVPYTLGVRGTNCGGTQHGTQSTVNVTIPNPQAPLVCAVFDAATANLTQISTIWYPLLISNSLQCGPVSTYNVTYAGLNGTDVYSIPAGHCSSNCSHFYAVTGAWTSSQYNVSVAGFGVPTTINTIASTNNILKVDVQTAAINCTFLSGLVGTSGCVVSFGTSPDHLPYTLISSQSGGSGQSVSVPLVINGSPVDLGTMVYYYRASLMNSSQCATVIGQTGCPLVGLGSGAAVSPHCTSTCTHGTRGVSIPNGCVCITGLVTGAQATYVCDAGYMLEGGGGARLCATNGVWSGASTPICAESTVNPSSTPNKNADESSTTTVIVAVVVCGCGLVVVLVVGVGVSMFLYRRHTCGSGQQDRTTATKRISPFGPDSLQPANSSGIEPPGKNYAEVITVRVSSGGGQVVKVPAPVDVTYSTLKETTNEMKCSKPSVFNV